MKSITVIYLPYGGAGKTSIALTEYHKYRLLRQSVGFVLPTQADKRHTLPLAHNLGVDIHPKSIITSIDGIRGKRFDRLIIDDIDICSETWEVDAETIYDIYVPNIEKLLVTTTDSIIPNITLHFCHLNNIECNIYRKADLVGYKAGYK